MLFYLTSDSDEKSPQVLLIYYDIMLLIAESTRCSSSKMVFCQSTETVVVHLLWRK